MASDADEFISACQAIADERYSGELDRGFAHLALQLAFPTQEFSDDQAEDIISIDRRGDLGLDGLFVDEAERQVLLFQSKSSPLLKDAELHKEISAFIGVPAKLLSDEWLAKAHAELAALANDFRVAVDLGYGIAYAFATASPITKTTSSTFTDLEEAPGTAVSAQCSLLGGRALSDHYKKLLLALYARSTDVSFKVREDQMHEPRSVERVIYLTLPAHEYVNACKTYDMELFRYNPRLYLGLIKVNVGIAATLRDDFERKFFHLLNNGITAVCSRFEHVDAGDGFRVLRVEDFQVVNGCQTTMTLFRNSAEIMGDNECLIDLKIIQSVGLRDQVSRTTNTQTSILAEDTFANAPEQARIQDHMRRHNPPYFYAPKRGAWDQAKAPEKRKYQDDQSNVGKFRKLTSKELAAVCLASFGEPEAAKDRPRLVFEKVGGKNSGYYEKIFEANNVAAQWLLPFELLRFANALVKEEGERAKQQCPDDPDCTQAVRARVGAYGRFRLVHLAYGYLRKYVHEQGDFLSPGSSEELLTSVGSWGPNVLRIGLDALVDSYAAARRTEESSGLREFFREKKHQPLVRDHFQSELERNSRFAERQKLTLAQFLGFPAPT